jgi:hypothetical protein
MTKVEEQPLQMTKENIVSANSLVENACANLMFLQNAGEDDPPVALNWINIAQFVVATINSGLAAPFAPVTEAGLKAYIMAQGQAPGATVPIDNFIFPCSSAQVGQTTAKLICLCFDPFFANVVAYDPTCLPIARVYVPRARSNIMDIALLSPPNQPALWG